MKKSVKRSISIFLLSMMLFANMSLAVNAYEGQTVFTNQESTAYVAEEGAKGASGAVMEVGYAAVHPKVPYTHNEAIFDFGTFLYIDAFDGDDTAGIPHDWGELYTLNVQDIGDVDHSLHPNSRYWVDVFWGNLDMESSADLYGDAHTISYHSSKPAKR